MRLTTQRMLACPEPNCDGFLSVHVAGPRVNNTVVRLTRCNVCSTVQTTVTAIIPRKNVSQFREPVISKTTTLVLEPDPKRLVYSPRRPIFPTKEEIKAQNLKVCNTCGRILPPLLDRKECWSCGDARRKAAKAAKGEAPSDSLSRFNCFTCEHSKPPANIRDSQARQSACSFDYPEAWTTEADDCFLHSSNVP